MANDNPEQQVRELYRRLIEAWDKRNARDYTLVFAEDATLVGYDGSEINGQATIGSHISAIFSHHQTAAYVTLVREVRSISNDVWLLRAEVGMIPPGKEELNPDRNAVQVMIAVRKGGEWRIALFQNTPAAWDGRKEDSEKLSAELREAIKSRMSPGVDS
jgi:uncharacterized protein (TIGR02246 family)